MNKNKRLEEIENDLSHNSFHKKMMLFMVIAFGISTALEFAKADYLFIICDVVCVILAAIVVSVTDKEDQELISERDALLNKDS